MDIQIIKIVEAEVVERLRLDAEAIFWLKHEAGVAFLHHYMGEEDPLVARLLDSKAYWNWWRALWATRDQQLMASMSAPHKLGFVYLEPVTGMMESGWHRGRMIEWQQSQRFYEIFHKYKVVHGGIFPPAEVVELHKEPIFNHK